MVVILSNEADNFEEEPDFTCPDAPERCSQTITDRVPHKNVEYVVLSRAYTQGDLTPVLKDTACNPEWPLAAYWPVYVANFRATSSAEQTVFKEVSHFFAYNGLLTRMILLGKHYGGEAFQKYQEDSMLFDMLVYFVSKEDADRAIATCHQVRYNTTSTSISGPTIISAISLIIPSSIHLRIITKIFWKSNENCSRNSSINS